MPDNVDPNFARYQQAGWIKPDDATDARQWRDLKYALGLDTVATWDALVTEINRLRREAIELRGELVELRAALADKERQEAEHFRVLAAFDPWRGEKGEAP